jgi:hypothetical protein
MSWYVDIGYEFYSSPIWHVIKCFVLKQEVLFSQVLYSHDITEVLLKVALDTITLPYPVTQHSTDKAGMHTIILYIDIYGYFYVMSIVSYTCNL